MPLHDPVPDPVRGPVNVRPVTQQDLPLVLEIADASPEAAQWSFVGYQSLLKSGALCWVAGYEKRVLGFLLARQAADELEILNLAVSAASRRKGVGSLLLREALAWAEQNGISKLHLEVRASNFAAVKLYEAHGFRSAGGRRGYYSNPPDDALLLCFAVAGK
ncbi:MAG TPA: ribosomal protein S18-alanine N-acetyltransferase [Candidatus Acidoferrales bacterium]|nr:ribosomal protein S18-alanine N-acetyltransferase [Candidatus Acidoferrales bacterium]